MCTCMHGLSYLEAPGFNRRVRSKIPDLGVDFGQRNNEEKLLEPSELELELELELRATDRPGMCFPTCQQLPWCPAHGHTSNVASPAKKPIVIVAVDVKKIQTRKRLEVVIWWRKV